MSARYPITDAVTTKLNVVNAPEDLEAQMARYKAKAEAYDAAWPEYACGGTDPARCEQAGAYAGCDRAKQADCPRLMRLAAEEERRRAAEEMRRIWAKEGIPKRVVAVVQGSEMRETAARAAVRDWNRKERCVLVLAGGKGCGKTVAAAQAVMAEARGGRFAHVLELVRAGQYARDELDSLAKATILVLDDLGCEYVDGKGFFLSSLDWLINARYADTRPTIITTNLPAEAFSERYGERIADRLREAGVYVELADGSMRGASGGNAP